MRIIVAATVYWPICVDGVEPGGHPAFGTRCAEKGLQPLHVIRGHVGPAHVARTQVHRLLQETVGDARRLADHHAGDAPLGHAGRQRYALARVSRRTDIGDIV